MYFALEGIDTAGKSTQIALLQEAFPQALITKEPGGTAFGQTIRAMVLGEHKLDSITEMLLFLADRREHYVATITPALAAKRPIFSDRSLVSGIAYALTNTSLSLEKLIELNNLALDGCYPTGIIILTLDEATLKARLGAKTHDGIEARGIDYLLRVQAHLIDTAHALKLPTITIDAALSIEAIHAHISHFISDTMESL
ncbi:MAG: hypothetical protein KU37_09830 [Sulfuricurvum sp. PC08-66]|nr:MAG: hypothetical protein KU37_09830 [Sulfuricurvum sp. PC08-66]